MASFPHAPNASKAGGGSVSNTVNLLLNGNFETGALTDWVLNPARPLFTVTSELAGLTPYSGSYMLSASGPDSGWTDIWIEQVISASHILQRYGASVSTLRALGAQYINLAMAVGDSSGVRTYGAKFTVFQYDADDNQLSAESKDFLAVGEDTWTLYGATYALHPSAVYFKLRITAIPDADFNYASVDAVSLVLV